MTATIPEQAVLTCRDRAILRAVAAGTAELSGGMHPDLFLEGRCCCDQLAAHRLVESGLIASSISAGPCSGCPPASPLLATPCSPRQAPAPRALFSVLRLPVLTLRQDRPYTAQHMRRTTS